MSEQNKSGLERHIQSIAQIIIVGLCAWMAKTTHETSLEIARLSEQVRNMSIQIVSLEDKTRDRYKTTDAARDFGQVYDRITDLSVRIRSLEEKHSK